MKVKIISGRESFKLPKLISVDATQITSDINTAIDRSAVSLSPYLMWNGSIIVTYFRSLMGSAKKSPPKQRWTLSHNYWIVSILQCSNRNRLECNLVKRKKEACDIWHICIVPHMDVCLKRDLPRQKANAAANGITAQISPNFGSYTVSAVPMINVPPTQVAVRHTKSEPMLI